MLKLKIFPVDVLEIGVIMGEHTVGHDIFYRSLLLSLIISAWFVLITAYWVLLLFMGVFVEGGFLGVDV